MMISALHETGNEPRVAITPNAAKQYIKLGLHVGLQHDAGRAAGFSNQDYDELGVHLFADKNQLLAQTQVLLCVNEPSPDTIQGLTPNALLIGHIEKTKESPLVTWCLNQSVSLFSMTLIPRISRAQSMDSLSSQANLAGYRAVLEAVTQYHRAIPMMMTAAGMIQPAKVLILGAGVAGLQAIATAKRLGAVVYAFDVRTAAKEQVESLGAEFIEVKQDSEAETKAGYAAEMSDEYKKLQAELIDHYAKLVDIIITTALIPGKPAPKLLFKNTIEHMKPGSVVVDLATSRGGNCEVSVVDQTVEHGLVKIIGLSNMAGLVATTASDLYANNLVHLIKLLCPSPDELVFNPEDDIIRQAVLCHQGVFLPFQKEKEQHHA